MTASTNSLETSREPANLSERLELANRLFREFRVRCFWHAPHDLIITEALIPFVAKGLRTYGGRRGFMLAATLQDMALILSVPAAEPEEN